MMHLRYVYLPKVNLYRRQAPYELCGFGLEEQTPEQLKGEG
jgi:hypothetical protein